MLIELANKLRCSMHRRCLRYYYSFVFNNPPFSPFLRVTLLQTLNTSGKPYHSKILKTHILVSRLLFNISKRNKKPKILKQ